MKTKSDRSLGQAQIEKLAGAASGAPVRRGRPDARRQLLHPAELTDNF